MEQRLLAVETKEVETSVMVNSYVAVCIDVTWAWLGGWGGGGWGGVKMERCDFFFRGISDRFLGVLCRGPVGSFEEAPPCAAVALRCVCVFFGAGRFCRRTFPWTQWMPAYSFKSDFVRDVVAGLTVGVMAVPQAMSYATVAGTRLPAASSWRSNRCAR
eukprot:COSAG02_NODE_9_length_59728_cov_36.104714_44_plen_159_part_00